VDYLVLILLHLLDHPYLVGTALLELVEGESGMRIVCVVSERLLGLAICDVEV
jgi:hypothetical protein